MIYWMYCLPVPPLGGEGGSLVEPLSQTRRSPPLPGSHGDGLERRGYVFLFQYSILLVDHCRPLETSMVCFFFHMFTQAQLSMGFALLLVMVYAKWIQHSMLCFVRSKTNGTQQQPSSLKTSGQEDRQSHHLHSSSYGRASRAGSVSRSDKEDSGLVVQVSQFSGVQGEWPS